MGLLLAPYNNAMRLGQGFNSYTQQICIDDAVIVDPLRPDNAVTNDGLSMPQLRALMTGKPAWVISETMDHQEAHAVVTVAKQVGQGDPNEERTSSMKADRVRKSAENDDQVVVTTNEDERMEEEEEEVEEDRDETGKDERTLSTPSDVVTPDNKGTPEERTKRQKRVGQNSKQQQQQQQQQQQARYKLEKRRETAKAQKAHKRAEEFARAAAEAKKPYTDAELRELRKSSFQVMEKLNGFGQFSQLWKKDEKDRWIRNPNIRRGPSQIVTYNSRFVDKLSEITDDMNISGSLSIKLGTFGGSGRGAFIDSDKFQESDLNFYISVKVINQTVNIKDALVYKSLPSVDEKNHTEVFGDSFISGFLEGGEFNALVSMKVLNKAKRTDIEAEAKVALTCGPAQVQAEANVRIAKENIARNTETTIQVSWQGGGFIKPSEQPWTVDTLMEVAARFPELVAETPQRTHAILTKYESLRSFMALKPAKLQPLAYENAAIYTNALMDAFMDYKHLYRCITTAMYDIDQGNIRFVPPDFDTESATDLAPGASTASDDALRQLQLQSIKKIKENGELLTEAEIAQQLAAIQMRDDERPFQPSMKGLDRARRIARLQMVQIVKEVDDITKNPLLTIDPTRPEPFQSPMVFRTRIPKTASLIKTALHPLTGVPIRAKTVTKGLGYVEETFPDLYIPPETMPLKADESDLIKYYQAETPAMSLSFRPGDLVGEHDGNLFSALEFLKTGARMTKLIVTAYKGAIVCMTAHYASGIVFTQGKAPVLSVKTSEIQFNPTEKAIFLKIEVGRRVPKTDAEPLEFYPLRITSLEIYTNHGKKLVSPPVAEDGMTRVAASENFEIKDTRVMEFEPTIEFGYLKGFWGRTLDMADREVDGILRLGPIWGCDLPVQPKQKIKEDGKVGEEGVDAGQKCKNCAS